MAEPRSNLRPQTEAGSSVPRADDAPRPVEHYHGDHFNPTLLAAAREAAFMTQTELAREMGVSQPLIARWEAPAVPGDVAKRPGPKQLVRLANVLEVHPSLFFAVENGPRANQATYYHRAFAKAKRLHVKAAHARCALSELRVERMLELCPAPDNRIPDIDPDNHAGDIDKVAALARARMGLPDGPVANLVKVIESHGGIVIDDDLDIDHVDALCRWTHGLPKLFFLNGNRPADRTRLSLAHELGHTVMHLNRDPELPLAERQAQRFAAAFLLPAAELRRDLVGRLDLSRLATLKRKWRVSMQAIAYRANQIGCIDDTRFRSIMQQFSRNGWRKTEPVNVQPESPLAFKRLLRTHLDGGYSEDELSSLLMLSRRRLADLLVDAASPDWEDHGVRMRIAR